MSNASWMKRLTEVECPDSTWRPRSEPMIIAQARGCEIVDASGRSYLDLCAGFGSMIFGHHHPELDAVFTERASTKAPVQGMGDVFASQDKIAFMESLLAMLPAKMSKVALAVTGSQAVEIALKTAFLHTGRRRVLAFNGSYHGVDMGVLAATWREDFKKPFLSWTGDEWMEWHDFGGSITDLEERFIELKESDSLPAAAIIEPIQGRSGVIQPPQGWLTNLSTLCRQFGVLLIFDDIFCGVGRSGLFSESLAVDCDLVCLGKALGGGMPLSACVGTESVMSSWPECESEALHTGTWFGHSLSCAMGLKSLEMIARDGWVDRSLNNGKLWLQEISQMTKSSSRVREVRGRGMMMAIEFKSDGEGASVSDSLRNHGVLAIPCGPAGRSVSISPPLIADGMQLGRFLEALKKSLEP